MEKRSALFWVDYTTLWYAVAMISRALLSLVLLGGVALNASVIGTLAFANCAAGGVSVSSTTIDFFNPLGGLTHNGCIVAGPSTLTFAGGGGSVPPGEFGTINDLGFDPLPVSAAGFIQFAGVAFNLASLGPGSANTICPNIFATGDPSCSVFAGSPFILTPTPTGITVTLAARGTASDGTSPDSTWIGSFTTQLPGITPFQIQQQVLAGQAITSTYSFELVATQPTAEVASMILMGTGLAVMAFLIRRRASQTI